MAQRTTLFHLCHSVIPIALGDAGAWRIAQLQNPKLINGIRRFFVVYHLFYWSPMCAIVKFRQMSQNSFKRNHRIRHDTLKSMEFDMLTEGENEFWDEEEAAIFVFFIRNKSQLNSEMCICGLTRSLMVCSVVYPVHCIVVECVTDAIILIDRSLPQFKPSRWWRLQKLWNPATHFTHTQMPIEFLVIVWDGESSWWITTGIFFEVKWVYSFFSVSAVNRNKVHWHRVKC